MAELQDLVNSVKALGIHATAELIAPQGMICSIVEFDGGVDLIELQSKSAGFV